jgi:hypothetical protein
MLMSFHFMLYAPEQYLHDVILIVRLRWFTCVQLLLLLYFITLCDTFTLCTYRKCYATGRMSCTMQDKSSQALSSKASSEAVEFKSTEGML